MPRKAIRFGLVSRNENPVSLPVEIGRGGYKVLKKWLRELQLKHPLHRIKVVDVIIDANAETGRVEQYSTNPFTPLKYKIVMPLKVYDVSAKCMLLHEYFHLYLADKYDLIFAIQLFCDDYPELQKHIITEGARTALYGYLKDIIRSPIDLFVDLYAALSNSEYRDCLRKEIEMDTKYAELLFDALNMQAGNERLETKTMAYIIVNVRDILSNAVIIEAVDNDASIVESVLEKLMTTGIRNKNLLLSIVEGYRDIIYRLKNTTNPVEVYRELIHQIPIPPPLDNLSLDLGTLTVKCSESGEEVEIKCIKICGSSKSSDL